MTVTGWLKVEENGTYTVHFKPALRSDQGLCRNLRENVVGLF